MLPRWYTDLKNIKLFLKNLNKLLSRLTLDKNKRGRPPKRSIKDYLKLIITKEFKKKSLREAETDYSEIVCDERIDHSVIHYWEKNLGKKIIEEAIDLIGKEIDSCLQYEYTFVDATEFTSWKKKDLVFHLSCRITKDTVYPTGIHYGLGATVRESVKGCLTEGKGDLLADGWYDEQYLLLFWQTIFIFS